LRHDKSAIHLARTYGERKQNYAGQSSWVRGNFVSTVGRDEAMIQKYIRIQEKEDERLDQLNLWKGPAGVLASAPRSARRDLHSEEAEGAVLMPIILDISYYTVKLHRLTADML
jgi:hypothetical protein